MSFFNDMKFDINFIKWKLFHQKNKFLYLNHSGYYLYIEKQKVYERKIKETLLIGFELTSAS